LIVDTEALRAMLDSDGPFASVYFDASHDTEDAAKEVELRWRAVRARLIALDTPKPTIRALDAAAAERHPAVGRAGRFMVAAGDRILLDEYLTGPPPTELDVRLSPVPYLLPLLESGQPTVPYVVVNVDKKDGRIWATAGEESIHREVRGREHPVHKVRRGWSHRNLQSHTEEIVKQNIDEVAGETTRLARQIGARLVLLIGDVEPRALLRHELPDSVASIAIDAHSERDAERFAAQVWHTERAATMDRFRAELGRESHAVQGMPDTTAALREGNVELLVINASAVHKHEVWIGSRPNLVAVDRSALHDIGISDRARVPADEALPAAALAVRAEVVTTDEDAPAGGVGAILRHT
jgi:hypothetical protein